MNADQRKWTEISIAYETEPDERTYRQRRLTLSGLCLATCRSRITIKGRIFIDDICWFAGFGPNDYWLPKLDDDDHTRQHDLYRATFAAFMSALSPQDIKEMLDNG